MPAVVADALKRHRERQSEDQRVAGDEWVDTGLVFTTSSGRHVEPRNLGTAYERLLAHTEVRPIRFHDLRHTCATLLLSWMVRRQGLEPRTRGRCHTAAGVSCAAAFFVSAEPADEVHTDVVSGVLADLGAECGGDG
jgi:hypothetical protein